MIKTIFLFVALSIISFSKSFAWGSKGHRLVAEIAFKVLDMQTQKNVLKALGGFNIDNAATWMDEQRSNTAFDEMKPWHFVEFNNNQNINLAKQPNVVTKLSDAIERLKIKESLSAFEVQQNLLYIFHLTGDISQPLHCGYKSDYGGNAEMVNCFGLTRPTSLHHIWDDEIIAKNKIGLKECLESLATITKREMGEIVLGEPSDWALDSRKYISTVYDYQGNTITDGYLSRNEELVKFQLVKAGLRLAAILTIYFKH